MGSNIQLPCRVHARPRAEITWLNNENKEIVQGHRHRVLANGDLLISEIKWEDMGNYKCIARNVVGKDTADTFVYPVLVSIPLPAGLYQLILSNPYVFFLSLQNEED